MQPPSAQYVYDCPTWNKWWLGQSPMLCAELKLGKSTRIEYFNVAYSFWIAGDLDHVFDVSQDQCILICRQGVHNCRYFASFLHPSKPARFFNRDCKPLGSDSDKPLNVDSDSEETPWSIGPSTKRAKTSHGKREVSPPVKRDCPQLSLEGREDIIDLVSSP